MSDDPTNEPTDDQAPPPPPPLGTPEPPSAAAPGDNRTLMVVLSYLYFFCLVPLFVEKDDQEVQWHAKHGLVLMGADLAVAMAFSVLSFVSGGLLGCLLAPFWALLHFALFIVRIVAIVKGTQGERLKLPVVSDFADKF